MAKKNFSHFFRDTCDLNDDCIVHIAKFLPPSTKEQFEFDIFDPEREFVNKHKKSWAQTINSHLSANYDYHFSKTAGGLFSEMRKRRRGDRFRIAWLPRILEAEPAWARCRQGMRAVAHYHMQSSHHASDLHILSRKLLAIFQ